MKRRPIAQIARDRANTRRVRRIGKIRGPSLPRRLHWRAWRHSLPEQGWFDLVSRLPLLSFLRAEQAGAAMFERWELMAEGQPPPFTADDAAWADLFRAGYERIR